jgi:predicted nucleic acid-binding protein
MKRYLLDTNHAGTLLNDQAPLWQRLQNLSRQECALSRPVVGELWFILSSSFILLLRSRSHRRRQCGAILKPFA